MMDTFFNLEEYDIYLICEEHEVANLTDGTLYVVCDPARDIKDALTFSHEHLLIGMDSEQMIYDYEVQILENPQESIPSGELFMAIERGANVILPLCTPNKPGKQYLVAGIAADMVDVWLPSMMMEAERITKAALEDALMNLAMFEPVKCYEILADLFPRHEEEPKAPVFNAHNVFYSVTDDVEDSYDDAEYVMPMAPSKGAPSKTITYQESREIFDRFVENCNLIRKASKKAKLSEKFKEELDRAKMEVDHVFNTVWGVNKNNSGFRAFFMNQSDKKLRSSFQNLLNREHIAMESKLSISIEASKDGIDKNRKNDGRFRVYVSNGKVKKLVHFAHKQACVVYMMYLLDKVERGDEIDTLNIKKNEKLFCQLYTYIYGEGIKTGDGGPEKLIGKPIFDALFEPHTKDKTRKVRLTDCYVDIRNKFEEIVGSFGENVSPFLIPNENSHLTVMTERITVPESFSELVPTY